MDASVVLKWFFPEIHTDSAVTLLDAPYQYVAPDLLFPEVGNAVWKRVRRGDLSADEGGRVIDDLTRLAVETVAARGLIAEACAIAIASGLTVYDSTYLALAVRLETQLVTADARLRNAVRTNPALEEHTCFVTAFPA